MSARRGPVPDDGDRDRVDPRFSVSRVDIDRPGPTYTIDTLRDLRAAAAPEDELFFITGADALAAMLSWHDVAELFALAHFVGLYPARPPARPGRPARRQGQPGRDPGPGHLLHRVPSPRR